MHDFYFFEPGVLRVPGWTGPLTSSHQLMLSLKDRGSCLHSMLIQWDTRQFPWGCALQKNHLSWNIEYPILLQTTVYFEKKSHPK